MYRCRLVATTSCWASERSKAFKKAKSCSREVLLVRRTDRVPVERGQARVSTGSRSSELETSEMRTHVHRKGSVSRRSRCRRRERTREPAGRGISVNARSPRGRTGRRGDAPLAALVVVEQDPPGVDVLRDPPLGDLRDEERLGVARPAARPLIRPEELEREVGRQDDLRAACEDVSRESASGYERDEKTHRDSALGADGGECGADGLGDEAPSGRVERRAEVRRQRVDDDEIDLVQIKRQ